MTKNTILLVDDEQSIRETLRIVLEDSGYRVITAEDGYKALKVIEEDVIDILITDLRMPNMNGLELMKNALKVDSFIEVIFISAYADVKCAVEAVKLGAFDYIQKSFTTDELLVTVEKAIERRQLIEENNILKNQLKKSFEWEGIIGKNEKMQMIFSMIKRVANTKATVLITGESGVGKGIFAELIHKQSPRRDKNFVVINCGAIPENLIESELFGHEKGAFTGALHTKIGKFEQAHGGTIFLDEIGELPLSMQVKFLRVLQERKFERIGSLEGIDVDVRVIAATNRDLYEEIKKGRFREDLYYRLNVININIPPLRERRDDIPLLAESFLADFSKEYNKKLKLIDMEVMDILVNHMWEGNVRELKNIIERAVVVANEKDEILRKKHLPLEMIDGKGSDDEKQEINYGMTLKEFEKIIITNTLKRTDGNKTKAAKILGIKRQTLYNKIKEYRLKF